MIIIADSGSTKTDWLIAADGRPVDQFSTQGINPFHQSTDDITHILHSELLPQVAHRLPDISALYFYGSGCRDDVQPMMCRLLGSLFTYCSEIECRSDLLGAARALCGRHEGIACILGTGSNSCLYDGRQITQNTPALGYILGDEGSGAVLGRQLLNALYKGRLSEPLLGRFEQWSGHTVDTIINKVYRQPLANRFLASLCPFIAQNISDSSLHTLVVDAFRTFIRHNILPYHRPRLPIGAVGSIAFFFQTQLAEAAQHERFTLGKILRSPITGLAEYHK